VNRKAVSWIMFTLLLTGIFTSAANIQLVFAHLPVHNINTDEYFETIQDAINAPNTTNGHTIHVDAGVYNEDLIVNKGVCLEGENRSTTIINGTGKGDVINVTASNVRISGFTINNSKEAKSCIFTQSQNLTVENCRIINRYIGIYVYESVGLNVTNSMIVGGSKSKSCIAAQRSSRISITYNELTNVLDGHGIDLNGSNTVTVAYNDITHNLDGVFLCSSDGDYFNISIENNYIADNEGEDAAGIKIQTGMFTAYSATIEGNTITNNTHAIYHSRDPEAQYPVCFSHKFYHNNFINNTYNNITFSEIMVAHIWNGSYLFGGNYWSNYAGNDVKSGPYQNETGSDGIGDAAYLMGQDNADGYPFMDSVYVGPVNLVVRTMYLWELYNVSVWIDNSDSLPSPVNVTVERGLHEVTVQSSFDVPIDEWSWYRYHFDHWEDNSKANPRQKWICINKTFTAYYRRIEMGVGK